MSTPSELIESVTLIIENPSGVVEVELGLFQSPHRWFVVQTGQEVLSGRQSSISREQLQDTMRQVAWPPMRKDLD